MAETIEDGFPEKVKLKLNSGAPEGSVYVETGRILICCWLLLKGVRIIALDGLPQGSTDRNRDRGPQGVYLPEQTMG